MKIVALNGSPTRQNSSTVHMVDLLLEGAAEMGAQTTRLDVGQMKIIPCLGCYACWFKTNGVCVQQDDMPKVIAELKDVDVLVFATPIFYDGMTAQLKATIDRLNQTVIPKLELKDGHCRQPQRDVMHGKMVLVAVNGFYEADNFDALIHHVKRIAENMDREMVGTILRPYAKTLFSLEAMGMNFDQIYEQVREVGRQLVRDGKVSPETETAIRANVIPKMDYVDGANKMFQQLTSN